VVQLAFLVLVALHEVAAFAFELARLKSTCLPSCLAQQKVCGGSMKTEEEDLSSVGDCFHRSMPPHTANHSDTTFMNLAYYEKHSFNSHSLSCSQAR